MAWDDQIFRYCERGQDGAFWAEPLNAVTNGAFIIAAVLAAAELARRPERLTGLAEPLLVSLVFVMGIGSFLFHTYATRWASYADTVPIGIFMLAYLAYALRRYAGLGCIWIALAIAAFVWSLQVAGKVQCGPGLLSVTQAAQGPCLNGTAGYVPAFAAMAGLALVLLIMRHAAWRYLALAAAIFLISMIFRTLDLELCDLSRFMGRRLGTHFLWHVLNATMLYVLLLAAIRHGAPRAARG
jgi:hypothetical protein